MVDFIRNNAINTETSLVSRTVCRQKLPVEYPLCVTRTTRDEDTAGRVLPPTKISILPFPSLFHSTRVIASSPTLSKIILSSDTLFLKSIFVIRSLDPVFQSNSSSTINRVYRTCDSSRVKFSRVTVKFVQKKRPRRGRKPHRIENRPASVMLHRIERVSSTNR